MLDAPKRVDWYREQWLGVTVEELCTRQLKIVLRSHAVALPSSVFTWRLDPSIEFILLDDVLLGFPAGVLYKRLPHGI